MTVLRCLLLCISLLFVGAVETAQAQDGLGVDGTAPFNFDEWEAVALDAETLISSDNATIDRMEEMRASLQQWREQLLARQSADDGKISILRDQISALGPIPAEGESESVEIGERRADLNRQLTEALAPVLRAEEAYTRAEGLIREIDRLVRERQTDRTLRLDGSPLFPVYWPDASKAVWDVGKGIAIELERNTNSTLRLRAFRENLPLIIVMVLGGLWLVLRAPVWTEHLLETIRRSLSDTRASSRLLAFAASAVGVALPLLGLAILFRALETTVLLGPIGEWVAGATLTLVATVFASRWLAKQVFPRRYPPHPILPLPQGSMGEARFYTTVLGLLAGMDLFITDLSSFSLLASDWSAEVQGVVRFPAIVLAGLLLFRFGQLLLRATKAAEVEPYLRSELDGPGLTLAGIAGRGAMAAGLLGPCLTAIGYVTAGGALIVASVLTLAVLGLLSVLQRLVRNLFAALLGSEPGRLGLLPVLVNFALSLSALPVLAMIWGMRPAELHELWVLLASGVVLGETRISPMDFVTVFVIFLLGYGATRLLQGALRTQILPKTHLDTGGRNAIIAGTGYVGFSLAGVLAITGAGLDLSSLAIVAGALSVGIGFGLQTIVSNFVSGIILLIERPISEGDWIEVGGTMGVVKDISVRATRVETFDRRDVIVPNADLISTSVTNWTKGNLSGRLIIQVGVAYGTDTRRVEQLLREIAEAHPMVIVNPPPSVVFMNFGADALEFEIRAILRDVNYLLSARSDINHEIARVFGEEGIEIPFAQRDVWLRNPESLSDASRQGA